LVPGGGWWWDDDENPRVDATVVWDCDSNGTSTLDAAAERLLQLVLPSKESIKIPFKVRNEMRLDVVASMQSFQEFCEQQCNIHNGSFTARLVASRGTRGAKCPVWHVDQVACRWIQALAGPGCEWVANSQDAVQWDQFFLDTSGAGSDSHHDGTMEEARVMSNECRNEQLVNRQRAIIRHAQEGEGVILLGSQRSIGRCSGEDLQHSEDITTTTAAAVHKSPEITVPWQGRVLLTLNVLPHTV
jgi:Protein of unknown function (DUF1826)